MTNKSKKGKENVKAVDVTCLKIDYILMLMKYLQLPDEPRVYNFIDSNLFEVEKKLAKTKKTRGLVNVLRGMFIDWPLPLRKRREGESVAE